MCVCVCERTGSCVSCCHGAQKILEHMIMRTGVRRVIGGAVWKHPCGGAWMHTPGLAMQQKYASPFSSGHQSTLLINVLVTLHSICECL